MDSMKRFIVIVMALLPLCSCIVRDGETESDMLLASYADSYQNRYVIQTLDCLEALLLVSEYEAASEDEKKADKYNEIRDRLRHIDNDTWYMSGLGKFMQEGSILNAGGKGNLESGDYRMCSPVTVTNLGDRWQIVHESENESMTVVFSRPVSGESWQVELNAEKKEDDLTVKFRTSDGTFSILDTVDSYDYAVREMFGSFGMEIFRSGQMIDYCYLKYSGSTYIARSSR